MARQFHRVVQISLGGSGGSAGTTLVSSSGLDGLKVQFEFESHTAQAPASIQIIVYNIDPKKAQQVQKEFTAITVQAGYEGSVGEIFAGTIVETMYGEKTDQFTTTMLRIRSIVPLDVGSAPWALPSKSTP